MKMSQTERIMEMEQRLDKAAAAVKRLSAAVDGYAEVEEDLEKLNDYYGSDEWLKDFAADEAGLLPKDLKRGVLSEDAIDNLLNDCSDLSKQMQQITNAIFESER
jgi:HEAT repeat protein